jgi:Translationally controlled tumour protein
MIIYKCRFTGDEMCSDAFKPGPVKDAEGNEVPGLMQILSQKVNKVRFVVTRLNESSPPSNCIALVLFRILVQKLILVAVVSLVGVPKKSMTMRNMSTMSSMKVLVLICTRFPCRKRILRNI